MILFSRTLISVLLLMMVLQQLLAADTAMTAEKHFVKEMNILDIAEQEREEDIAQEMWYANQIARIGENSSWFDTINNWVGVLFLSDESVDITRALTGDVTENLGTLWSSAEVWEKFIDEFHQMSRSDQRIVFFGMQALATETNVFKVKTRLVELLDPTQDFTAIHALDKATAGTFASICLLVFPLALGATYLL
ncbi:MAG: hypothetical protein ACKE8G_06080 [Methylophagaceae bacterium]